MNTYADSKDIYDNEPMNDFMADVYLELKDRLDCYKIKITPDSYFNTGRPDWKKECREITIEWDDPRGNGDVNCTISYDSENFGELGMSLSVNIYDDEDEEKEEVEMALQYDVSEDEEGCKNIEADIDDVCDKLEEIFKPFVEQTRADKVKEAADEYGEELLDNLENVEDSELQRDIAIALIKGLIKKYKVKEEELKA